MDWELATKLIKAAKDQNQNYSVHFEQVRTADGYGYTNDFECPLCKDGLFGRSIAIKVGLFYDTHAMACPTCGAVSGPWIPGDACL